MIAGILKINDAQKGNAIMLQTNPEATERGAGSTNAKLPALLVFLNELTAQKSCSLAEQLKLLNDPSENLMK